MQDPLDHRQIDLSSKFVVSFNDLHQEKDRPLLAELDKALLLCKSDLDGFFYSKNDSESPCPLPLNTDISNLRYVPMRQGLHQYAVVIVVNSMLNDAQSRLVSLAPYVMAMVSLFKSRQHQERLNSFSTKPKQSATSTLLNSLLENAFQPVILFDDNLKVIKSNSSAQELFNSNIQRGWSAVDSLCESFFPDIADGILKEVRKTTYMGQMNTREWREVQFKYNPYHSIQVDINLFECEHQGGKCFGLIIKEKFSNSANEDEQLSAMQRFSALSNVIPMAILQLDSKFQCNYANTFWSHYTGQSPEDTMDEGWKSALAIDDANTLLERILKSTKSSKHFHDEISLINTANDASLETEINAVGLFNEKYEATGMIMTFRDISESKDYARKLENLSQKDHLTGLTNRTFFSDRLNVALSRTQRHGKAVLMLIDLDKFKHVNDSYGHNAGDAVLQEAANRISECVRDEDCVARIGGDEFAVVISDLKNAAIINTIANNIVERLGQPIVYNHVPFYISCSIGVSVSSDIEISQEDFVKQADLAMYSAKNAGRAQWCFYDEQLENNAHIVTHLKQSLNQSHKHEFSFVTQSIVNVETAENVSVELLCRWQNEVDAEIGTEKFIRLIEESGLINSFSDWQVTGIADIALRWIELGFINTHLTLSFNLSALLIGGKGFGEALVQQFASKYLKPSYFCIDVTETSFINNPDTALSNLKTLKKAGFSIALDDFGTGYSSLSHLRKMPIDTIKIDSELVQDVCTDANSAEIVKAIIDMANALNIKVIAEGVETSDVSNWLREHGCVTQQGFLFSKPMDINESETILFKSNVVAIK